MPVSNAEHRLHAAMVGIGNPFRVLTPRRLPILAAALNTPTPVEIAAALGIPSERLDDDLAALASAGIVSLVDGCVHPLALIVNASEVAAADRVARGIGAQMAHIVEHAWPLIEAVWRGLTIAEHASFADLSFLLVGDRLLDVGLLDALASDGRLMPPAPPRNDTADPAARYYLYVIEGDESALGQYGQRSRPLPWDCWHHLTFGRYGTTEARNPTRDQLDVELRDALREPGRVKSPEALASLLGLPLFAASDAQRWDEFARALAGEIVGVYRAEERALRDLFASLRCARTSLSTPGELLCWLDHLAYAHAIDALVASGRIVMPPGAVTAAIWCEDGGGAF